MSVCIRSEVVGTWLRNTVFLAFSEVLTVFFQDKASMTLKNHFTLVTFSPKKVVNTVTGVSLYNSEVTVVVTTTRTILIS